MFKKVIKNEFFFGEVFKFKGFQGYIDYKRILIMYILPL